MSQNWTLKNGSNGKLYGTWILGLRKRTKQTQASRITKVKLKLHQDLSTAKESIKKKKKKSTKRQPMEWEKIVANDATDKGLISKTYTQLT